MGHSTIEKKALQSTLMQLDFQCHLLMRGFKRFRAHVCCFFMLLVADGIFSDVHCLKLPLAWTFHADERFVCSGNKIFHLW